MRFTPFKQLPRALVEELEAAGLDPAAVYDHVGRSLEEDLPDGGEDLTSAATIPAQTRGVADFQAREEGVVAGLGIAALVFTCVLGDEAEFSERVADGSHVGVSDVVLSVSGPVRGLLTAERTALNYASHLSGVATATSRWVAELEGLKARVLDTRKTLPGLRALQKYAVRCGGGVNHRSSLTEMTMVKDNHVLAAGGVVPAFEAVLAANPGVPVEVEVTDLDQLTPREKEVLRHIARGYTYKEVAARLHLSVKTVETHVSAVLRKLQLSNRHELTAWANERRLL